MEDETQELEGELAERQNAGQQLQARLSRAKDAVGRRLTSLSAQLQVRSNPCDAEPGTIMTSASACTRGRQVFAWSVCTAFVIE